MLAFITGASSGLGVEFARLLAMNGYDLIITARRKDRLMTLKNAIEKKYGVKVAVVSADLSDVSEVLNLAGKCFTKKIDVLINNAGFGILGAFNNMSGRDNVDLINTNITSLTLLSQEFIKTQKKGYILNVASIAAFLPGPLLSTYYASKAYVLSLSTAVNEELKRSGKPISVTTLCPGPMKTEFFSTAGASKEFATAAPRDCAKRGLKAMFKRKSLVFSDNLTALGALGSRFLPLGLITKVSYMVQRSKLL